MCPVAVRLYGSTSKKEYQLAVKGISVTKLSCSYLRRYQDDQPGWMYLKKSSQKMPAQAFIEGLLLYSLLPYQAADIIHTKSLVVSHPNL